MDVKKRYYRAVGIAEYIIEGHTLDQAKEEFRMSKENIRRQLIFLANYGNHEEQEKNIRLYKKAKIQLQRNSRRKK